MSNPHLPPISPEEALRLNGKPGYTPKDALDDREKALARLASARLPVERRWVVLAQEDRSCDRHGPYTSQQEQLTPPTPRNQPFWTQCPHCDSEIAMEQKSASLTSAEMRKTMDRMRLVGAGIPERYLDSDFWNFQHRIPEMDRVWNQLNDYAMDLMEVVETGRCAILLGSHGVGKTHLACAVLRKLLLKFGGTGHYLTQARFISRLKSVMDKKGETEQQVYDDLVRPDLLVLDEIGRGSAGSWERNSVFRLIDERYQRKCKPTMVITNLTMSELAAEIESAGLDRMKENGGIKVNFSWSSQRLAKPEADA